MTRSCASERGAAMVLALMALGLLSIVVGAWLRIVEAEHDARRREERYALAEALADAGLERALAWFAEPQGAEDAVVVGGPGPCGPPDLTWIVRKRCLDGRGWAGFRTPQGDSQFEGVFTRPAAIRLWRDAERFEPAPGVAPVWRHPLSGVGVVLAVRLAGPLTPDGIATVYSRAEIGGAGSAIRAELIEGPWHTIPVPLDITEAGAGPFPTRVHWGEIWLRAPETDLTEAASALPRRVVDPVVTGEAYGSPPRADGWIALKTTGRVVGAPPATPVTENQPLPRPGIWRYESLKSYAKARGRYFATRGTGLLYPNDEGPGQAPSIALSAVSGDGRLIFIDTVDQRVPGETNLDTLRLPADFLAADLYVGAHLVLSGGDGRSVTVDAPPPPDRPFGPPAAVSMTLNAIHVQGVLMVAGELRVENAVRLFGAVVAQRIRDTGGLEIWYDASLRSGYRRGMAPVLIKPGSRRTIEVWLDAAPV